MLRRGAMSEASNHSEYTSYVDGGSISRETMKGSDSLERNIMAKIVVRQKTRKQSLRRQNLYDVVDDELRPMIDSIDKQNSAQGETGGTAEGEGEGGGARGGGEGDQGEEPGDASAMPAGLNWLRVRSLAAVLSLAQDPQKLNLVRRRTEQTRKRWKDTFNRVKPNQHPTTFRDVVALARKSAEEGDGKNTSNGDDGKKGQGATKVPVVSFTVQNENSRRPGAGLLRAATTAGDSNSSVPKTSKWFKVKAASGLKKPGDPGASEAETFPLETMAEVHSSGSGSSRRPLSFLLSTTKNTLAKSALDEEAAPTIEPLDDDTEGQTQL